MAHVLFPWPFGEYPEIHPLRGRVPKDPSLLLHRLPVFSLCHFLQPTAVFSFVVGLFPRKGVGCLATFLSSNNKINDHAFFCGNDHAFMTALMLVSPFFMRANFLSSRVRYMICFLNTSPLDGDYKHVPMT